MSDDAVFSPVYPSGPFAAPKPFDPGPLMPNTTYYWHMVYAYLGGHHGGEGYSDKWTFTTDGTTPTESAAWGQIKAIYK